MQRYQAPDPHLELMSLPFTEFLTVTANASIRDMIFCGLSRAPDKNFHGEDFDQPDTTEFSVENLFIDTHDDAQLDTLILTPNSLLKTPAEEREYIIMFNGINEFYLDGIKSREYDAKQLNTVVIGFDYRGHRYSKKNPERFSDVVIDGLAQVQRLLDEGVDSKKITLAGDSFGGAVATFVAHIFHRLAKPVYLWNERSFSSLSKASTSVLMMDSPKLFKNNTSIAILNFGIKTLISANALEAIVVPAYNEISEQFKGYMVVAKKSSKTGSDGDGVIDHFASLHKDVVKDEKKKGIRTGHKVIFHATPTSLYGHCAPRTKLISKEDSAKTGQDVFEDFFRSRKR